MKEIPGGNQENLKEGQPSQDSVLPYGPGLGTQDFWDEVEEIPEMDWSDFSRSVGSNDRVIDKPSVGLKGIELIRFLQTRDLPTGRDYHQKERVRKPFILKLTQLGLSTEDVAEVIECSPATVQNDRRRLGLNPERAKKISDYFQKQFHTLIQIDAKLEATQKTQELLDSSILTLAPSQLARLRDVVLEKMKINEFLSAPLLLTNEVRSDDAGLGPYCELVSEIFDLPSHQQLVQPEISRDSFGTVFEAISNGKECLPSSLSELSPLIVRQNYQKLVQPDRKIPDGGMIDSVLTIFEWLSGREQEILRLRYGLVAGTRSETLEEVGNKLHVSKERIRSIQARALRKMRQPTRNRPLHQYVHFKTETVLGDQTSIYQLTSNGLSQAQYKQLDKIGVSTIHDIRQQLAQPVGIWIKALTTQPSNDLLEAARQALVRYDIWKIDASR